MSLVNTFKISVTQNKMMKTVVRVPQWEAHVLLALWGDDAEVVGTEFVERVLPEVKDEFQRLADKYGPKDEDVPTVAKVFGSFGPGLRALENEIKISIKGAKPASSDLTIDESDDFADFVGEEVAA